MTISTSIKVNQPALRHIDQTRLPKESSVQPVTIATDQVLISGASTSVKASKKQLQPGTKPSQEAAIIEGGLTLETYGYQTTKSKTGCLLLDFPPLEAAEQDSGLSLEEYLRQQSALSSSDSSRFESLSVDFQGRPAESEIPRTLREAWAKESSVKLSDFLNHPFRESGVELKGGDLGAEMQNKRLENLDYSLTLTCPESGSQIGTMSRALYFSEGDAPEVHHSYFELDANTQKKGVAKELLARSVEMYDKIGAERVTLTAGLDVGGYAWAKYGFKPESCEETIELFDQVQWNLKQLSLPSRTHRLVSKLLENTDPRTVWTLSDLQHEVNDGDGRKTTLGKALLLGTCWQGELELKDQVSRARFQQYVGS